MTRQHPDDRDREIIQEKLAYLRARTSTDITWEMMQTFALLILAREVVEKRIHERWEFERLLP